MVVTHSSQVKFEDSISDFTFRLFNGIDKTGNVCLSPLSISATLLMLILGTNTRSKSQIKSALSKKESPLENINENFEILLDDLLVRTKQTKGLRFNLANQFLINRNAVTYVNYHFKIKAMNTFKCLIGLVDFQDPYTRERVNDWTERHTGGKIKNFIPDGLFNDQTYMVLLNAMFFKGPWKTKFKENRTKLRPFWITKTTSTSVQMMYQKEKLKATEDDALKCKVVELPYKGQQFSMIFMLPNEKDGLTMLEKKLSKVEYKRIIKKLRNRQTQLMLPKFKIETRINIKTTLRSMNISDIFNPFGADFTQMIYPWNQNGPLYISNALHEASIEVDEEGSKATAVTSLFMAFRSASQNLLKFTVDHPFLFLIRDVKSDTILFIGRCVNPDLKQKD